MDANRARQLTEAAIETKRVAMSTDVQWCIDRVTDKIVKAAQSGETSVVIFGPEGFNPPGELFREEVVKHFTIRGFRYNVAPSHSGTKHLLSWK